MQHTVGVQVYLRGLSRTFHRSPDCVQLQKRPARGTAKPIEEIDLADLNFKHPCLVCFPDAPRAKVVRRFCPKCNKGKPYPCAHNGGVRVTIAYKTSYVGLLRDPGDEVMRHAWVWPDKVHFYEPIAS